MGSRVKGYPIPPKRVKRVIWVNDTPHMSNIGAADHRKVIALGNIGYNTYINELFSLLDKLLDKDDHRAWNYYMHNVAKSKGSLAILHYIQAAFTEGGDVSFMLDKLTEDKLDAVVDPVLDGTIEEDTKALWHALEALPDNPLTKYEKKLFLKYAGNSSVRTGEGYMKQIRGNYLAKRPEWLRMKAPEPHIYDRAYRLYRKVTGLEPSYQGSLNLEALRGFLTRARTTTFGGYPYLRNMADYVSEDEDDPTTYADLYNRLAIAWLYLKPVHKEAVTADFIALERVQPGGFESISEDELQNKKDNKQRFVQAQSAMISHAIKLLVDGLNIHHKLTRPTMYADKFGEDEVTVEMKRLTSIAFASNPNSPEKESVKYNIVGTDFTNFDANQDIAISNDIHYNNWRLLAPAWMTIYVIDPYVKMVYRDSRILVPEYGLIQTTGVRSGMGDTNQTDTDDCGFCDIYELCWFSDRGNQGMPDHWIIPDDEIITMVGFTMCNGDDRFKLTYLSADDIEAADGQLGYPAQKQKQEVLPVHSKLKDLNVTYLKTIIVYIANKLVRTDSVAKLILARMHPESAPITSKPVSTLVDFFMSASRSAESPNLYILVDYMYARLPIFRQLLAGEIDFEYIIDHMVAEQYEELRLLRGKKWLKRKGMIKVNDKGIDYSPIIEKINTKYGYGDEGYRGARGGLNNTSTDSGLVALPQVQAILACAYERIAKGVIGETFYGKN